MGLTVSEEAGCSVFPFFPFWRREVFSKLEVDNYLLSEEDGFFWNLRWTIIYFLSEEERFFSKFEVHNTLPARVSGECWEAPVSSRVIHIVSWSFWLFDICMNIPWPLPCAWQKAYREGKGWRRRERGGRLPGRSEAMPASGPGSRKKREDERDDHHQVISLFVLASLEVLLRTNKWHKISTSSEKENPVWAQHNVIATWWR